MGIFWDKDELRCSRSNTVADQGVDLSLRSKKYGCFQKQGYPKMDGL